MRILIISGSFPPMKCGVGDYTSLLAGTIAKQQGMKVAVLTSKAAQANAIDPHVEVLPIIKNWGFHEILKVLQIIHAWSPSIVHIQYPTRGYGRKMMPHFLPMMLKIMKIQVVQTWHEPLSRKGWFRNLPNALMSGALVVVEPDYKMMLPGWYRRILSCKKIKFIPVGSSISQIKLKDLERHTIRASFDAASDRLIAYFGFVSPSKGIESLFDVCDPATDRIALICDLDLSDPYHNTLLNRIKSEPWAGKIFVTGFQQPEDVARILAASDAAVFPFVGGVSFRNTSVLAAKTQGTFVLTTSSERHGYDPAANIYYARLADTTDMRRALKLYSGNNSSKQNFATDEWDFIGKEHLKVYRNAVNGSNSSTNIDNGERCHLPEQD